MHRIWFVLLALSLGLNVGLLYERHAAREHFVEREGPRWGSGKRGQGRRSGMPAHANLDPEEMAQRHLDRMSEILDLTPEQRETMETAFQESIRELLAAQEEVGETRRALRDLFLAAEIDSAEVLELVTRLSEARGRVERIVSRNMMREAALLTPEQRARYVDALPWQHRPDRGEARPPRP